MAEGDALDQKRMDYRAWITWMQSSPDHQSRTCLYGEISEMIATFHQGVITVEIKRNQNTYEASDEDPTDAFSRHFITHDTRLHLSAPLTIGRP